MLYIVAAQNVLSQGAVLCVEYGESRPVKILKSESESALFELHAVPRSCSDVRVVDHRNEMYLDRISCN